MHEPYPQSGKNKDTNEKIWKIDSGFIDTNTIPNLLIKFHLDLVNSNTIFTLQSVSILITIVIRWPDLNVEKGQISQEKILDSDSW